MPRLYNRIYGTIKERISLRSCIIRSLANKGIAAKTAALNRNATYTHGCYDCLVFKKMKNLLGGRVKVMITGSAPIDLEVLNFLKVCFCAPVLEGYGLTETSGGTAITDASDPVAGHVGGPLEMCKFRLRDVPEMNYLHTNTPHPEGELQIKGANVTSGYYKRPDENAKAFDQDGWFNTGDVVRVFPNGAVKIIDRSKNIFKLQQGEYIAPEKLENVYILEPLIA